MIPRVTGLFLNYPLFSSWLNRPNYFSNYRPHKQTRYWYSTSICLQKGAFYRNSSSVSVNEIHGSLSSVIPSALALLDLSAAFDTIDHATLLDHLKSTFGLSGRVCQWFSVLIDRFQSMRVGTEISHSILLWYGIPQGSALGPILFSYILHLWQTSLGIKI